MVDNYFNDEDPMRPYVCTFPAEPETFPALNAIRENSPPPILPGFWPCEKEGAFVQVEDHRARDPKYYSVPVEEAQATEYWLPEDTFGASPRTMQHVGPLPEGAILTPPKRSREEAKEYAMQLLVQKRLEVEYAGPLINVGGNMIRFPSEIKDETRLNSLTGVFAENPTAEIPDWKVADGTYVTMTAPLLQEVKNAGFAHIAASFSVERAKRTEVEALPTAQAIEEWIATSLNTGWMV